MISHWYIQITWSRDVKCQNQHKKYSSIFFCFFLFTSLIAVAYINKYWVNLIFHCAAEIMFSTRNIAHSYSPHISSLVSKFRQALHHIEPNVFENLSKSICLCIWVFNGFNVWMIFKCFSRRFFRLFCMRLMVDPIIQIWNELKVSKKRSLITHKSINFIYLGSVVVFVIIIVRSMFNVRFELNSQVFDKIDSLLIRPNYILLLTSFAVRRQKFE